MKTLFLTLCSFFSLSLLYAQTTDVKQKEALAKELHKVLLSDDREQWKKYIKANFTQAFIDRPMQAKVAGDAPAPAAESKPGDNLEKKVQMFQRLHDDFGNSKIQSIKVDGDVATMAVTDSDGLSGTFKLKFTSSAPLLLDGMGIQLER